MEQATEVSSHSEDYWSDEGEAEEPTGERLADKKAETDKAGSVKGSAADKEVVQALQGKIEALEAAKKALETDRNALKARYESERAESRSRIKALEEQLEAHKKVIAGCRGLLRLVP